jgi:hypothetical protein
MKIHQHNLAVNAFMQIFGVIPEQPRINLDPPALHYLVVSVNGKLPIAVADGQTLLVSSGDVVEVVHIGANYDRGLSVDIKDLGGLNDIRLPVEIKKPTTIIARRDNISFGQVNLKLLPSGILDRTPQLVEAASSGPLAQAGAGYLPGIETKDFHPEIKPDVKPSQPVENVTKKSDYSFLVQVDGVNKNISQNEVFTVKKGAKIKFLEIESVKPLPPKTVMNLRGFVGRVGDVTGNDKGTTCDTGKDMISRFSMEHAGKTVYQLGAEDGQKILAKAYIEVLSPKLRSVTFESEGTEKILSLGQRWNLVPGTKINLKKITIEGNIDLNKPRYTLGGRPVPSQLPQVLTMPTIAVSLAVFDGTDLLGKVVLSPYK